MIMAILVVDDVPLPGSNLQREKKTVIHNAQIKVQDQQGQKGSYTSRRKERHREEKLAHSDKIASTTATGKPTANHTIHEKR